jgi:hypothetical protein
MKSSENDIKVGFFHDGGLFFKKRYPRETTLNGLIKLNEDKWAHIYFEEIKSLKELEINCWFKEKTIITIEFEFVIKISLDITSDIDNQFEKSNTIGDELWKREEEILSIFGTNFKFATCFEYDWGWNEFGDLPFCVSYKYENGCTNYRFNISNKQKKFDKKLDLNQLFDNCKRLELILKNITKKI